MCGFESHPGYCRGFSSAGERYAGSVEATSSNLVTSTMIYNIARRPTTIVKGHRQNGGRLPAVTIKIAALIERRAFYDDYEMSVVTDKHFDEVSSTPGVKTGFIALFENGEVYFVSNKKNFYLCCWASLPYVLNSAVATHVCKSISKYCKELSRN